MRSFLANSASLSLIPSPLSSYSFPYKAVLSSLAHCKVKFFCGSTAWHKTLSQDNLKARSFAHANIFYLCWNCEESIDHIFLHSPFVLLIWSFFFTSFLSAGCFPPLFLASFIVRMGSFPNKKARSSGS